MLAGERARPRRFSAMLLEFFRNKSSHRGAEAWVRGSVWLRVAFTGIGKSDSIVLKRYCMIRFGAPG